MKCSHIVSFLSAVCALSGLAPCHGATALRGPASDETHSRVLEENLLEEVVAQDERQDLDADFAVVREVSAVLINGDSDDPDGHRLLQTMSSDEQVLLGYIQQIRKYYSLASFQTSSDTIKEGKRWAKYMASTSTVKGRDPLSVNIDAGWRALAENDASAADLKKWVQTSSSLRTNILNASYNRIGLGVVKAASGLYYICVIFKKV